ncbi:MAG TPA: NAD(P)H-dependent oxidoreductase [Gemmatimonadales bacterium]|nr:NAD(P)H-dependent oxidoreductase [Gemmatimonadales bacterium]
MAAKRVLLIQGHPDPGASHYCHALADAYAEGARDAGHEIRRVQVAALDFPVLRTREQWESTPPPESIRRCQDDVRWAEHLVIIFPLWLGGLPALLRAFLEQLFRPGFAFSGSLATGGTKGLRGKSAHVIITMGMPAPVYRWYFGAHSLRSLERNILKFCGIAPVRDTIVGSVESGGPERHGRWLEKIRALGRRAR